MAKPFPTQLTLEAKWDEVMKKIKVKSIMELGGKKFKIKNQNFIYFHIESTFDNAPVKHSIGIDRGGIVKPGTMIPGDPIDEKESITLLHEPFIPEDQMYGEGGFVLKEISESLPRRHDHEVPMISIGFDPAMTIPEPPPEAISWNEGMEGRKCLNCQKEIGFGDYCIRNESKISKENLVKIWESPYVQLYCCSCFRKQEQDSKLFERLAKKRERLINKAYRLCEKFGFLVD